MSKVSQVGGSWRSDAAPVNEVVEVWYINSIILAIFDGGEWKTVDGSSLSLVSHWRRRSRG